MVVVVAETRKGDKNELFSFILSLSGTQHHEAMRLCALRGL